MHTSNYIFRNPKSNGEHDQRIFLTFLMLHKNRIWAKSDEQTKIFKWEPMTLKTKRNQLYAFFHIKHRCRLHQNF